MATTITAGNATNGAAISSDNTGILELKTGTGAGTTAVTIGTNQAVTFAGAVTSSGNQTVTGNLTVNGNTTLGDANTDTILMTAAPSIGGAGLGMGFGFRNRIINGDMRIDQRNAGASVTPNNAYTLDRWQLENSQTGKVSIQQNAGSVTPPAGFVNYLGVTSLSAYSVAAGDYFLLTHIIEGLNTGDLAWGTANAQAVTISFWVRSSLTGTFGAAVNNSGQNRTYPFTYTISAANTWEQKTVTIPGDTSGTWLTTNGIGIRLRFNLGTGATYSGTAGAWTGTSNVFAPTGATSVVGTNGATFYITGVQLEKGSTATSFDYRPYGTELMLCQRYFIQYGDNTTLKPISFGSASSTSSVDTLLSLPVEMRAVPTISASANLQASDWNNALTVTSVALGGSTSKTIYLYGLVSGATQYRPYFIRTSASNGYIHFSAEL